MCSNKIITLLKALSIFIFVLLQAADSLVRPPQDQTKKMAKFQTKISLILLL